MKRTFIYFVILTICAVLLSSCTQFNRAIDKSVEPDSCEQFMEEYDMDYVPTVQDVLQQREQLRYAEYIDSVYLEMPEQILTHMLVTKGTCISTSEIVEDYLTNKQFYHDTILRSMNIQKNYVPDSLPKINKPEKPLNKNDTVNKINNPQ